METKDHISVQQFCAYYNVPVSFINALSEFELIEMVSMEETTCINKLQIKDIEKMIRLHFELDINMEGIDAICNLLKQVDALHEQITILTNKLDFHEHQP